MVVTMARIDGANIVDWDSFHEEFHRVFEFPDFYGRNMDAWIDCMTSLDEEAAGMTGIHVKPGGVLTLEIVNARRLKTRPQMADVIAFGTRVPLGDDLFEPLDRPTLGPADWSGNEAHSVVGSAP